MRSLTILVKYLIIKEHKGLKMATSLLTLIDDIASVLDDVAILTKAAAKKTSGVIGDDLALNAQQVNGLSPDKELPIIYAVAKGALLNKVILVPAAMLITFFMPSLITVFLLIGGAYLCFEGVEKILEKFLHSKENHIQEVISEEDRIKGAIKTDFILSAEIIVISLGSMVGGTVLNQFISLSIISVLMTFGVYGLVAMIVKIDDLGLLMMTKSSSILKKIGSFLLVVTPYLMKILGVVGTIAMFLVGGGIITHAIPSIHHALEQISSESTRSMVSLLVDGTVGVLAGLLIVGALLLFKKVKGHKNELSQ